MGRAHYRFESIQMATLSWRHSHVVRAVVSTVSDFGGANGGNNGGKRVAYQLQLHLAMGPDLGSGTRQTVPETSEAHQQELARG